jgi:transposase
MSYIDGKPRKQKMFLPDCIDDMVSPENPVRVMDAFVDNLNMGALGFNRSVPRDTGRPGYDPRDLLKLYIYGYFNAIRSSRKLMYECHKNLEVFFLLNRLTPDFRTISDFRKDNRVPIKNVFREFVSFCREMNLYKGQLLAIDGTKIRAANSKMNSYNRKTLDEKIERIDRNIREYLDDMDSNDETEEDDPECSKEEINTRIETLKERKNKYEGYIQELDETGETQILTTDPEARVMHGKDGFHCAYNVQTAVDGESHLIAEYEVTNNCTDQGLLNTVAEKAKIALGKETIEVVADKGYESRRDILECIYNGTIPQVALKYDKKERIFNLKYIEAEITEEEKSSTKRNDILNCLHAGVLPDCFKNTAISLEVQELSELSCFIRNEDNTVTCPMGEILHKTNTKGNSLEYANKDACRQCTNRCTGSSNFKKVRFGPNTKYVPVRMYGKTDCDLQRIPKNVVQNTSYNSLYRKDHPQKKVTLIIRKDKEKLKQRMCLVEHPYGTVKRYHNAYYLLCRGKEKAEAEMGLSFLVYNMKRAINMVGVRALMEAMG